jgi:RimJ/RimL family protein N-acetyltransferase
MLEALDPGRYAELIPLYRDAGGKFPIILAVLEGSQPGQVFTAPGEADAALVVHQFGFMRLIERRPVEAMDAGLSELFGAAEGAIRPSYLLWYDPPPRWQERLDALGSDVARRRERLRFAFDESRAAYATEPAHCPEGFSVRRMDRELLPKAEKFGLALESRFWPSAEPFLEHGLPVCVVKDGEIASLCYGAAVGGGAAEVDVATDPEFRQLGLGTVAAEQFVRECLAAGIEPAWDCFTYNAGSMKLAEKLGFVPDRGYAFYSFNIPVALPALSG